VIHLIQFFLLIQANHPVAVDMFDGTAIADVVSGSFQFTLGHYNNGYRVIRLN
jgi:hypothetical protein